MESFYIDPQPQGHEVYAQILKQHPQNLRDKILATTRDLEGEFQTSITHSLDVGC